MVETVSVVAMDGRKDLCRNEVHKNRCQCFVVHA